MIKISNLSKKYGNRVILKNVNLELPKTGVIALVGASGSGKTTLLNALGGIDINYDGEIYLDNYSFKLHDEKANREFRIKNIGYVFQNFNLFNLDTALQNVLLPNECCSKLSKRLKKQRAIDLITHFGLEDKISTPINKLSGGQKQRIAIIRALMNDPILILADEPTGALDEKNGKEIYKILRSLGNKALVVIATHDVEGVKNIADKLIRIKNGEIEVSENEIEKDENPNIIALGTGSFNKKPALPLSFQSRHAFQKMKVKKVRTLITNLTMSLALVSIGVTLIVKNNAENKVKDVFSDICRNDIVVMEPKRKTTNLFNGVYSASKKQVSQIAMKYNQQLNGVGTTYLINFEDFFNSRNEAYISSTSYKYMIPGLSARSINDFRLYDSHFVDHIYPYAPGHVLRNDEIMVGLSFEEMSKLCFALQIRRSYKSLGQYICDKEVTLAFHFANESWQYEDEQIFRVRGVIETRKECIYHPNLLWNEIVFEQMMKMIPNDGSEKEFPWEMYKVYYLNTLEDPSVFMNDILFDETMYDYVFERTNHNFNPTLCKAGEACDEKRVFVFFTDKSAVNVADIKKIRNDFEGLNNFYLTSPSGYASYGTGIVNGFSNDLFFSLKDDLLDDAIDAATSLYNDELLNIALPKGIARGNYLLGLDKGVKFSSKIKTLREGRTANSINEIVISQGLADILSNDSVLSKSLLIASFFGQEKTEDEKIYREFRKTNVQIVGITDEEEPYVYHDNMWTISFFRDKLGISNFMLSPTSVVFETSYEGEEIQGLIKALNSAYHQYNFYNPVNVIVESMSQTFSYISNVLIAFSLVAIMISIILQCVIVFLNISESKNEISLFRYLGVSESDIASNFIVQSLCHTLIAFILSALILFFTDFVLSAVLSKMIGGSILFNFDPKTLLIVLFIALIMNLVVTIIILFILGQVKLKKIDFHPLKLFKKHY